MVLSKRALGRGLDSLIPLHETSADSISSIDIRDLRPNPYQPRRVFDDDKLQELANSIREHGILQPIVVRKSAIQGFDIVAGERRFRAAKLVGLHVVPAIVRDLTDIQLMEIAIIENLQRADLNPLETAEAYVQLIERCGYTQEQLAKRIGQSRSHIANMMRLLQLSPLVREYVSRGTLSMGHARALLAIQNKEEQEQIADLAVKQEWSVRKLEAMIYEPKKTKNVSRETKIHERFKHYEEQVRQYLGTSVRIQSGKNKGKIEIEYFSEEDLERILQLLMVTDADGV
ncbi:chromosome partitioning protein, ParB family [Alicyclobacillus tolerans]|uniref:Chromosome partitioning protein, ParB family n=1 Tax=Alicyclobacillus tolerans TaxID=90970 RepID=A0A1M6T3G4_9BACL|nr:chromosome partitioning protein, ParB family [Alicyclobacillus montanus]